VSVVYGYFGQNSPSINAMICSSPAYSRKKKKLVKLEYVALKRYLN